MPDLFSERVDYRGDQLLEADVPTDPLILFDRWLADALAARDAGRLAEPTAMVVATSVSGRPSSRTVLLKEVDQQGFVFFSNYESAKGAALASNPYAALHFGWYPLHRQVRVEGEVTQVDRAESVAYFARRPRGSQLGAWASAQSSVVESRQQLSETYRLAEERFADVEVACPENWGGYRVSPTMIEFWQGQPSRMHDRLRYARDGATWTLTRLAP